MMTRDEKLRRIAEWLEANAMTGADIDVPDLETADEDVIDSVVEDIEDDEL